VRELRERDANPSRRRYQHVRDGVRIAPVGLGEAQEDVEAADPLEDLSADLAADGGAPRRAASVQSPTSGPTVTSKLAGARERVGWELVRVHADGSAELAKPGVSVNLGGLAKGYALDRMLALLEKRGIENALLSFGQSSTWALGRPADAPGWRLLARGPDERVLGVLMLENQALSVSGSLGQWVEIGGRRYGHVLDPRTGEALQQRRQALVVEPDASLTEALRKALLVLGKQEGLASVDAQEGCEALLVDADAGAWLTTGWNAAVRFDPLD